MIKKTILLLTFLVTILTVVKAKKNNHSTRKSATCFPSKNGAKKPKIHDILSEKDSLQQLTKLRKQIDDIDYQIFQKMARRMQVSQKIGEYKRNNGMRVLQSNRWDEVLKKRKAFAQTLGLDTTFTINLLELIHRESIRKQTELIK